MSTQPLPLSDIINVNVSVAAGAVAPRQFNQGLIVGPSAVIPSTGGSNPRVRQYASLAAMVSDGFITSDPEYIAASIYFGNGGQLVWVGRQDLTAIKTAIPHTGNAGTGYAVGDVVGVTQSPATGGFLMVTAIGGGGAVTTLATIIGEQGTGYVDGTALATTGGAGTGLEVDITAVGESYLQAVQAISLLNNQFYLFGCCNASDADQLALGNYSTANWQTLLYLGSSSTAAIPTSATNDVASTMKADKYKALISYNTTQGGEFDNNVYAWAGIMGIACGLNTGAPGSAFTLNLKELVGISAEPLSQTQFNVLQGPNGNDGKNCNTCGNFGPFLGYLVNGILSSGDWLDAILFRATLVNLIQVNLMNVLVSTPKIPQTNAGEQMLIQAVEEACQTMLGIGYLGEGVWEGADILNGLVTGQNLPNGYLVQAPSFATQSSGDRNARKAMPITAAIIEAGAVHSVQVNVNVQM